MKSGMSPIYLSGISEEAGVCFGAIYMSGCFWPIVRIEHCAAKAPFALKENNQTPINNEGV